MEHNVKLNPRSLILFNSKFHPREHALKEEKKRKRHLGQNIEVNKEFYGQ